MGIKEPLLQSVFVDYLKKNKWKVFEQAVSQDRKRADIIAYRSDVDVYIGFELKIDKGTRTWTKALIQIIKYQKKTFKITPSLWCLVVGPPKYLDEHLWPERFFWRFGIGLCSFPAKIPRITYIKGDNLNTIFLDKYSNDFSWKSNTPKNTRRLAKKINDDYVIWNAK